MEILFWSSVALIAYVYAGYPVLLGIWARLVGKPPVDEPDAVTALPGVSVGLAARNEARRLPARIDNLLASDYPQDRLQIIVASDGSTDQTIDALAPYQSRIELVMLPPRGKAAALNAAVSRARHPILVFADARQQFAPDAIRRLVRHFTRLSIGAVSGELVLDCERTRADMHVGRGPDSTIADGVGAYWKYEKWLRRREAIVGSTLGVTGAIFGPMRIVLQRYRVVFDETALAFDETARDAAVETRRKVRTLAGNFQLLALEPRLLVPGVNPVWFQFVSHKLGRLLVPYGLGAAFVSSLLLAPSSWIYAAAAAGQVAFYGLAAYGALLERRARLRTASAGEVMREAA
jgi:glycosyltransferase involved in cell wall biosynthesis